jgi:hypothetical protein
MIYCNLLFTYLVLSLSLSLSTHTHARARAFGESLRGVNVVYTTI